MLNQYKILFIIYILKIILVDKFIESKVIEDVYPLPTYTQFSQHYKLGPECALIEQNENALTFSNFDWSKVEISKVKRFFRVMAEEFKALDTNKFDSVPTFKLQRIKIVKISENAINSHKFYNDTFNDTFPFGANEYYDVRSFEDSINVYCHSVFGAIQAIKTLLLSSIVFENTFCLKYIPYRIDDRPRFPYRGLLLDTGRSYFSVDYIKSIIKGISLLKFNVLHWHLTDDQSFSMEVGAEGLKNLHLKGANHLGYIHNGIETKKGAYYKKEEIIDIHKYANKWGIRLIPEIDIPAHTRSWGIAFQNLTAKCPILMQSTRFNQINKEYTFSLPLDISLDFTYTVIESLIDQLLELFKDPYLHLGGDEVDIRCWGEDKDLVQRMRVLGYNSPNEYINYFKKRMETIVNRKCKNKTIIQWEDILELEDSEAKYYSNHTKIYQMWKGDTKLLEKIKTNKDKFIWSYGNYLDPSYQSCKTFEDCYNQKQLGELQSKYPNEFIGVEACAWEMVQEDNIKGTEKDGSKVDRSFSDQVWYKLIAISEKIWTSEINLSNPNFNSQFIQRAQLFATKLKTLGVPIGNNTISKISIN